MIYTNKEYAQMAEQANAEGKILVAENGGLVLKEAAVSELSYTEKRRYEYPPIGEQLDMIYHDFEGWKAAVAAIKAKYPKD